MFCFCPVVPDCGNVSFTKIMEKKLKTSFKIGGFYEHVADI